MRRLHVLNACTAPAAFALRRIWRLLFLFSLVLTAKVQRLYWKSGGLEILKTYFNVNVNVECNSK